MGIPSGDGWRPNSWCGDAGVDWQGMALVASIKGQLRHWKPLLSKLVVEAEDDVEMIKVVEGYALRCARNLGVCGRFSCPGRRISSGLG